MPQMQEMNMPRIERKALETEVSLSHAKDVMGRFCNDRVTYPDGDVHSKRGICKILAEEYCPLICLAQEYRCIRGLRLLPKDNPGADGEIRFWFCRSSRVQIICANEGYDRALMREQLRHGKIVFPRQSYQREKGKVVNVGRSLTTPAADVQSRICRILKAIEVKESKYYSGTDSLLVQDDPADFKHLKEGGLQREVCEAVRKGLGSSYRRIFVNYGNQMRRIK